MRKYKTYSGTKPTSDVKSMAVYSGGKYFALSQTTGKESLLPNPISSMTVDGTKVTVTIANVNNKDSAKEVLLSWSCMNPNVSSTAAETNFPNGTSMVLGPNTSWSYTWDASSALKPGANTVSVATRIDPLFPYQEQSVASTLGELVVYKKFSSPTAISFDITYTNNSYDSSNPWPYAQYRLAVGKINYVLKMRNPNSVNACCYDQNTGSKTTIAAGTSAQVGSGATNSRTVGDFGTIASTTTLGGHYYYLNSALSADDANTRSPSVKASTTTIYPPQLVSCLPSSATSTSFQVTVKNNNSSQKYCYVKYFNTTGSGTGYRLANCPANGTGTLITSSGSGTTFTMARGSKYVIMLYFVDSRSYTGKQISNSVYYPFQAPDSGYLYVNPIVVSTSYDDDSAPTKVTFNIANNNAVQLCASLDLYSGTGTSGTRVDFWKVEVPAMSSATCPNTWSVSTGSTYTLKAYFSPTGSSYHGTAVSGVITYTFTVEAET